MTIPAREGDRCPTCGTPLEPVELSGTPLEAEDEFVLRCANGHEQRVLRHHSPDDEPTDAIEDAGVADVVDDTTGSSPSSSADATS